MPNDYITSLNEAERAGKTVLLHNGQYREDVVDLYVPGRGLDFIWKRSYQSGISLDGFLGKNWDFNWAAQFIVDNPSSPTKGRFSRGDARRDIYGTPSHTQNDEWVFNSKPDGYVDIKTAMYTSSGEVKQTKRNGFAQIFDLTTGRLKSRKDRYGNTQTVIYDANGRISRVQDTLSRYIDFSYYSTGDASGRISRVNDFTGRGVNYEYACTGSSILQKCIFHQIPGTTIP